MKHSELRHQPRHVNPRIQGLWYNCCIKKRSFKVSTSANEYYGAVTPQIRQAGNRLSGLTETACTSLLA